MHSAELRSRLASALGHDTQLGSSDALTDVAGVRVGHHDVRHGSEVVTGVTAVRFDALESGRRSLPAGVFVGNGHGKLVGSTQVDELGALETPIVLTSTLSAFLAADALVGWVLRQPGHEQTTTLNPFVAECNDGWLSDIRARAITTGDVEAALDTARAERPAEGAVGAGSGMVCMGYKGGVGTASRVTELNGAAVTVGALTLTNFGGDLRVGTHDLATQHVLGDGGSHEAHGGRRRPSEPHTQGNSCIVLLVTDAPVDARQLGRLAHRGVFAMGRVGASYSHGSGDYGVAVSTAEPSPALADHLLDPLLTAALETSEAALVSSLLSAETTQGHHGRVAHGLPIEALSPAGAEQPTTPGPARP